MFNIKQTTLQSKQCPKINHPGVAFQTIIEGGSVVVVRWRCGENFGWGAGLKYYFIYYSKSFLTTIYFLNWQTSLHNFIVWKISLFSCIPVFLSNLCFPVISLFSCIPVFLSYLCFTVFLFSCHIFVLLYSFSCHIFVLLYSCIPVFLSYLCFLFSCFPVFLYSCFSVFMFSCHENKKFSDFSFLPLVYKSKSYFHREPKL